jgi:hypothetical protein
MPTWSACLASAKAAARPFTFGTESRTIVQPRFPGGQATRVFVGGGGGGFGVVAAVVVGVVVVGSGAVVVSWMLVSPVVATIVPLAELERSASQIAETTPAVAATTRASRVGQIQSPG